jgi:hypothetical protein
MPRQARWDAPRTLHHVRVRGPGRCAIFRDDAHRADFVGRLPALAEAGEVLRRFARESRGAAVIQARDGIAYLWVEGFGHPGRPLAPGLGVCPQAVYQAARRGRQGGAQWEQVPQAVSCRSWQRVP